MFVRMSLKLASTVLRTEGASILHRHDAAVVSVNHRGARVVFLHAAATLVGDGQLEESIGVALIRMSCDLLDRRPVRRIGR